MPGPPPKKEGEKRRRNAPMANTVHLPAEGRTAAAPLWPGPGLMPEPYRSVWDELWALPQAIMWERQKWTRVVARYILTLSAAEDSLRAHEPDAKLLTEARNLEDRLGLTPMALLRLRWEIVEDVPEEKPARVAGSTRNRLKAVDGGLARK